MSNQWTTQSSYVPESNILCTYQTNFLVLSPGLHNCRIIDTIDNDTFDPFFPECVLALQIVGDLLCGSGGSESSWKTH
jgi:hypothetical protein